MNTTKPIKIGYSMSLTGPLGANGQTALLAHRIWEEDVNGRGGLLGRPVRLICVDDKTDASLVAGIYRQLLDDEQVDLVIGGYGNNSLTPAMPLIIERKRYFVGLMGLGVNARFDYPGYFVMIPTGPSPTRRSPRASSLSPQGRSPGPRPSRSSRLTQTSHATRSRARARMPASTAFGSSARANTRSRPGTSRPSFGRQARPTPTSCSSARTCRTRSASCVPSTRSASSQRWSAVP